MNVSRKINALIGLSLIAILLVMLPINSGIVAEPIINNIKHNKVVIINFDDNRKSQFTNAKPILDKYGFKATFYVVCNYVDNKKGYMNWNEVETLHSEGHDIGSHSMSHVHLSNLTKKEIKYQVGQSKKCLQDHGIEATSFAYPFNDGSNDDKIVKIVSQYYKIARTANDPIAYLRCDAIKDQPAQSDCKSYSDKHHSLDYDNMFTIGGWSQDFSRKSNVYADSDLFKNFTQVVNGQDKYNEDGAINAIPIIIYHRVGEDSAPNYNTDMDLFEKEMKYLHDRGFTVLTMADLAYDDGADYMYVKQSEIENSSGIISSSASAPASNVTIDNLKYSATTEK